MKSNPRMTIRMISKRMISKVPLVVGVCALTGCVTSSPPTVFVREVPTQTVSTSRLDVIRFPATYNSYTVGRRIDPRNPGVMQESHVFYVRESQDRWNLNPAPAGVETTPLPAAPPDAAFAPLPIGDQLRQELQQQRQFSNTLNEQAQRIREMADKFVPAAQRAVEMNRELNRRQEDLNDRLNRLEQAAPAKVPTGPVPSLGTNR